MTAKTPILQIHCDGRKLLEIPIEGHTLSLSLQMPSNGIGVQAPAVQAASGNEPAVFTTDVHPLQAMKTAAVSEPYEQFLEDEVKTQWVTQEVKRASSNTAPALWTRPCTDPHPLEEEHTLELVRTPTPLPEPEPQPQPTPRAEPIRTPPASAVSSPPLLSLCPDWEMDEDNPVDNRLIPGVPAPPPHLSTWIPKRRALSVAPWAIGAVCTAVVALLLAFFFGDSTELDNVSGDFVRVSMKSIQDAPPPPKQEKREEVKPAKSKKAPKSRARRPSKRVATRPSAPPSSTQATQQASKTIAALHQLSIPTTNLTVVKSPGRGGTPISGITAALAEGQQPTTGIQRIATSTDALNATDQTTAVRGSKVSVSGRVKPIKTRDLAVDGSLSKDAIQRVVKQNLRQIRRCYERELVSHPTLQGTIKAQWVISPTGSVSRASAPTDTLGHAATTTCVLNAIRSWRFPQPSGGSVRVAFPFTFTSTGA